MYGLCGPAHSIRNIYQLCVPFLRGEKVRSTTELKPYYLEFIGHRYEKPPINQALDPIVEDKHTAQALLKTLSKSQINDLYQESMAGDPYPDEIHQSKLQAARQSLESLGELNQELFELLKLAVHSIVISRSNTNKAGMQAHGGSTSKLPGLMWLTLKPELSGQDVQELFIHELTHTLVFLDELNHGHFNYSNLNKDEFWARSSILNRSRPMDKVVHSILVACEVLHARATFLPNKDTLNVHPDTDTMKANTLASIESVLSLKNLDQVCLPRSIELTEKARLHLRNL